MSRFQVLAGLPGTGPVPEQFSATGLVRHSEGPVVEFHPESGQSWVGNFQPGLATLDTVIAHPDGQHVIVVAGGQAYVVSPLTRQLVGCFGGQIIYTHHLPEQNMLVLCNGMWFEGVSADAKWRTRRLSWDGMRNLKVSGDELTGEAWGLPDNWVEFRVNLRDGSASGGSYYEVLES